MMAPVVIISVYSFARRLSSRWKYRHSLSVQSIIGATENRHCSDFVETFGWHWVSAVSGAVIMRRIIVLFRVFRGIFASAVSHCDTGQRHVIPLWEPL